MANPFGLKNVGFVWTLTDPVCNIPELVTELFGKTVLRSLSDSVGRHLKTGVYHDDSDTGLSGHDSALRRIKKHRRD